MEIGRFAHHHIPQFKSTESANVSVSLLSYTFCATGTNLAIFVTVCMNKYGRVVAKGN